MRGGKSGGKRGGNNGGKSGGNDGWTFEQQQQAGAALWREACEGGQSAVSSAGRGGYTGGKPAAGFALLLYEETVEVQIELAAAADLARRLA